MWRQLVFEILEKLAVRKIFFVKLNEIRKLTFVEKKIQAKRIVRFLFVDRKVHCDQRVKTTIL